MALERGSRLGRYEIVGPLGAGGMGEVYEARDTRLDRRVAIKVLPPHLAEDEQLRQRLEREARAVSALSHPNICTLYDVGSDAGVEYLVLEFLEGESLAERLERGALDAEELMLYAVQITDGLDKAHRAGIIHRDLKPGNVMLTKDGAKLLDFGLAKTDDAGGLTDDLTSAPTMSQPLTAVGTIMGTFQYMAPEQLEGGAADARSDLFALGAMLHEMATGRPAFQGGTQASLIGSILHERPPLASSISPDVPPALDRVIQVCLAKDPDQRWQTAHDVLLQLRWIAEGGSVVGAPAPAVTRRRSREPLAWALAGLATLVALGLAWKVGGTEPEPGPTIRFEIPAGEELRSIGSPRISPDGRTLAYSAAGEDGRMRLWKRPLDSLVATPIAGTEQAGRPFWSPDSQELAFFAEGKLRRVGVAGGQVRTVCDAPTGSDGTWGTQGQILFDGGREDPILGVPATGGVARPVVPDPGEGVPFVGWPEFLPDGKHFLYLEQGTDDAGDSWLMVGNADGEPKRLVQAQSRVQYAEPGYLIYVLDGTLVGQRFSLGSLELEGDPIPLVEEMETSGVGLAHFSASTNGILVLLGETDEEPRLVRQLRSGRVAEPLSEPGRYGSPALSPDGERLAASRHDPEANGADVWILDLNRGVWSRLTFEAGIQGAPLWSPDGEYVYYTSQEGDASRLMRRRANGTGEEALILENDAQVAAHGFSPDGHLLALNYMREGNWGVYLLPFDDEGRPGELEVFVDGPGAEIRPSFSPDGRYLLYELNSPEGRSLFVAEVPGPGGRWQIPGQGQSDPSWSADGSEIFFLDSELELQSVSVSWSDGRPLIGAPQTLFRPTFGAQERNRYTVSRDAQTVYYVAGTSELPATTVVVGWSQGLSD